MKTFETFLLTILTLLAALCGLGLVIGLIYGMETSSVYGYVTGLSSSLSTIMFVVSGND